jgi:protein gp37
MSKTKIEWCTDVINPITGCLNGCEYCYARRFAYRLKGRFGYPADDPFRPTFHSNKLDDIYSLAGTGKRIFLDSMGDWFSPGVNPDWIKKVLFIVEGVPEHTFLVLTKRPDNIPDDLRWPENLWMGVSVTCQDDVWRIDELVHNSPLPQESHLFVSFEPLHGSIQTDLSVIEWIIIGAETGNRKGKIIPELGWIQDICTLATFHNIPVFLKNNLQDVVCGSLRQEIPRSMVVP